MQEVDIPLKLLQKCFSNRQAKISASNDSEKRITRRFPPCSGLPEDILDLILVKLTLLADYDRFGAVCVSWRNASLAPRNRSCRLETRLKSVGVPLLLLLSSENSRVEEDGHDWTCSLYDVGKRIVVQDNIKLPALPKSHGRCCGSSHGWLIMADDFLSIRLLNPFYLGGGSKCGGGMIQLPPLNYPPWLRFMMLIDEDEYISELSICKVVLSANPALAPKDYVVMVIYGVGKSLAFIKSGDKDWTYVRSRIDPGCYDVVYCNGKIYAVDCSGILLHCDTTEPVPRLRKMAPAPYPIRHLQSDVEFYYLVESPQNQLLLVCRMMVRTPRDNDNDPWFQTTGFKIFKLLVLGKLTAYVELKTLGDSALFLGDNHSTCVPAAASNGFPRVQPNSIYFTDHALSYYTFQPNTLRVPADMGVFNLEDQSLGKYYDLDNNLSRLVCVTPPVWFLPSFPGKWA
ncbi:putative F-box protein At5g55150 [Rhododendron vialii]|uniref:putative F-box protein At5g55150 n=1 Tax=Rhododendron vialii TaxID=182163 RepID=UPI00265D80EF|nr:putative F-box protein At5g55150 [Rhododendron vialii]